MEETDVLWKISIEQPEVNGNIFTWQSLKLQLQQWCKTSTRLLGLSKIHQLRKL